MIDLSDLRAWIAAEIAREDEGIRKNRAAGLMHMNDQSYMGGVARNSVRREIMARMDEVVTDTICIDASLQSAPQPPPLDTRYCPDWMTTYREWWLKRLLGTRLREVVDAARKVSR